MPHSHPAPDDPIGGEQYTSNIDQLIYMLMRQPTSPDNLGERHAHEYFTFPSLMAMRRLLGVAMAVPLLAAGLITPRHRRSQRLRLRRTAASPYPGAITPAVRAATARRTPPSASAGTYESRPPSRPSRSSPSLSRLIPYRVSGHGPAPRRAVSPAQRRSSTTPPTESSNSWPPPALEQPTSSFTTSTA